MSDDTTIEEIRERKLEELREAAQGGGASRGSDGEATPAQPGHRE